MRSIEEIYQECVRRFEYRDGKLFNKYDINSNAKKGQESGYEDKLGYRHIRIFGKQQLTHRIIFLMNHKYLPEFIDHIDGNPRNNLLSNLRECTQSQNILNINKGDKYIYHRKTKRCLDWHVKLPNQKMARFKYKSDAITYSNAYMIKKHGEFARLNTLSVDQCTKDLLSKTEDYKQIIIDIELKKSKHKLKTRNKKYKQDYKIAQRILRDRNKERINIDLETRDCQESYLAEVERKRSLLRKKAILRRYTGRYSSENKI